MTSIMFWFIDSRRIRMRRASNARAKSLFVLPTLWTCVRYRYDCCFRRLGTESSAGVVSFCQSYIYAEQQTLIHLPHNVQNPFMSIFGWKGDFQCHTLKISSFSFLTKIGAMALDSVGANIQWTSHIESEREIVQTHTQSASHLWCEVVCPFVQMYKHTVGVTLHVWCEIVYPSVQIVYKHTLGVTSHWWLEIVYYFVRMYK